MITICSKHPVMTEWSNFKKQNAAKKQQHFTIQCIKDRNGLKFFPTLTNDLLTVCVCTPHVNYHCTFTLVLGESSWHTVD